MVNQTTELVQRVSKLEEAIRQLEVRQRRTEISTSADPRLWTSDGAPAQSILPGQDNAPPGKDLTNTEVKPQLPPAAGRRWPTMLVGFLSWFKPLV